MKYLTSILFTLLSFNCYSATHVYDTKIKKVFVHETDNNGTIYFIFEDMQNGDDCLKSGNIAATNDNVMFDKILSIGLAALMSKSNVGYTINGCSSSGHPRLTNLWVE
ncbi:hypothetical protein [Paraglaciecola sp.]|uniref:hypothetical protein n=1 Tax=Paraglaciecola sp. TaxID=1920173 RepID=UPI003267D023